MNSVEWNDGMERWSGLLEWSTGLDYWSATPTKLFNIIHVYCSMASHLEKQLKNKSKVVWGAMPNPGTQTRSKVKNISSKVLVGVDGETSATLPVVSGVPQGSVLGPLLFLIYIDGLSRIQLYDGTLIMFADDIVIYQPICNARDFLLIQNDTDTIPVWIKNNLLMLNVLKCKQMILSRKQHPAAPLNVKVDGNALEIVDAYKYLGVWITSDLSWAKQIEENCKKANQKIGMLYQ